MVFISTEQNGSYVIRQNNIKEKTLCVYYFFIKRKKLFGQPNIMCKCIGNTICVDEKTQRDARTQNKYERTVGKKKVETR